jgi:hypothetical protein
MVASTQAALHSSAAVREFADAGPATFHFEGYVDGVAYPSLSPAQQDTFKANFVREVSSLRTWCRQENWLPSPPADLQIFVSDEYKIAKSLVPAALGHRGRMEVPAWKAIAGEAAIMHELVHIYLPNGNRFLAEGLAIYLQNEIGGNPTFPNFGRPLHQVARELLRAMLPGLAVGKPDSLDNIHLADLDKIATPSPLRLRVGRDLYENTPTGQAHLYPIAGSFAQFLIETHGTQMFRALFERTPLIPMERNPGSPDRWVDAYGRSLLELELEWKSMIVSCLP